MSVEPYVKSMLSHCSSLPKNLLDCREPKQAQLQKRRRTVNACFKCRPNVKRKANAIV
uniref:Uncharacterized protein n=1 Tax=Anguilla anguilla TaxID=7936 RepID=A0A0E9V7E0_ANGAN